MPSRDPDGLLGVAAYGEVSAELFDEDGEPEPVLRIAGYCLWCVGSPWPTHEPSPDLNKPLLLARTRDRQPYAYVNGNPINLSDPDGHMAVTPDGNAVPYCYTHNCTTAQKKGDQAQINTFNQQEAQARFDSALSTAIAPLSTSQQDAVLTAIYGIHFPSTGGGGNGCSDFGLGSFCSWIGSTAKTTGGILMYPVAGMDWLAGDKANAKGDLQTANDYSHGYGPALVHAFNDCFMGSGSQKSCDFAAGSIGELGLLLTPVVGETTAATIDETLATGWGQFAKAGAVTGGADTAFGPVPESAWLTLLRVESKGSPFPGFKGGSIFRNEAGALPSEGGVIYREWDVNPYIKGAGDRGGERIVTGSNGTAYYTNDHYLTFTQFAGAP